MLYLAYRHTLTTKSSYNRQIDGNNVKNINLISSWSRDLKNHLFDVCLKMFNDTFNNISVISWRSILLVEETGGPGENHRPVTSHWQTLSHNVVPLTLIDIRTHNHGNGICTTYITIVKCYYICFFIQFSFLCSFFSKTDHLLCCPINNCGIVVF